MTAIRPLIREAALAYYRWAQRDLQRKDPTHPDLPYVIHRVRDLLAERYAQPCYLRKVLQWL